MLTQNAESIIVFPMIKLETMNLAVLVKEKKAFTKFCKENGLKIYAAASEALSEYIEKRKAKRNG